MSTVTHPILDPPAADARKNPAPDSIVRRTLGSSRIVIGGGLVLLVALICIGTLPLTLRDHWGSGEKNPLYYNQQVAELTRTHPTSHPFSLCFGTDIQGRSLLSRCLLGGTISLAIGIAAATISVVLGVSIGLLAGYRGGWIDSLLMRTVDVLYGLPYILLIILLKIALEPALHKFSAFNLIVDCLAIGFVSWRLMVCIDRGQILSRWTQFFVKAWRDRGLAKSQIFSREALYVLIYVLLFILIMISRKTSLCEIGFNPAAANLIVLFLAIGLVSWLTMARVVRGQVLSLRVQPFIEACRASGLTEWRIFTRHLLPNLIGPITVYATLTVPQAILQESFLSFLGIGIQKPVPTWGSLASDGLMPALNPIHHYWYMLLTPCLLLSVTLLSLNFLGDGLRDVFDPKRDAAKA